jgi:uncharacterized protein YndB with AHSA1/START domain
MATRPEQIYQIFIKATAEQIWDAITRPEFTSLYFHGSRVQTSGEAGSPIRYYAPDGSTLWGVVSWRSLFDPELSVEKPSRVTWEIESQEGGFSKLTVTHDRLEGSPKTAESVAGGWMFILSGMKTVLETGKPLLA